MDDPSLARPLVERRAALRRHHLPDLVTLWYGDEEAEDRRQLERFDILAIPDLTPQQRAERLNAVAAADPRNQYAQAAGARVVALGQMVEQLRNQGVRPTALPLPWRCKVTCRLASASRPG